MTDNSFFQEKVNLRLQAISGMESVRVLDCFAGTGKIWKAVKRKSSAKIFVLGIEKERGKNIDALPGSNLKYLASMNLSRFDVIDLDAYGILYDQLSLLFRRGYSGRVIVTAIQSGMGQLPTKLLFELGYSERMLKKTRSIFNRNGVEKLKKYLYLYGCQSITGYFIGRKNYFYFNINP